MVYRLAPQITKNVRQPYFCGTFSVGNLAVNVRFEELSRDVSVEFLDLFGSPFHKFALTLRGFSEGV